MNDRIVLYWFSGTGNTFAVTRAMADVFEAAGKSVELVAMEDGPPAESSPGTTVGLAVPVACGNTYDLCWEFIMALPDGGGAGCFLVDTLAAHSGGLLGPVRDVVTAKGYQPLGAREIRMASNFLTKPKSPEKVQRINVAGLDAARGFAKELLDGSATWRGNSFFQRLAKKIARSRGCWRVTRWLAKIRIDAAKCTGCGLCAEICPTDAITMIDVPDSPAISDGQGSGTLGRPEHGGHVSENENTDAGKQDTSPRFIASIDKKKCQVCLRCAGRCPAKAIAVRTANPPYLYPE
ncbi:MAG: 4Fe-4S binding protein [Phycisphaerales bacterium]|nr:4Fe-4S binding protein [Phycisphaerales bacterium]